MKISLVFKIILLLLIVNTTFSLPAQEKVQKTRILFVLDASQSMYARWENGNKMQVATRLLRELVDSLSGIDQVEIALRIYGHQYNVTANGRNCKDTKLEVPFSRGNHDEVKKKLRSIRPRGTTLIAYSLEQAAGDFQNCSNCRNVIILITDGIEECDGDPCAVSMALQKKGIALKPFVIGLGLEADIIDAFKCVGNYYDATDEATFKNVLGIVISQALNNTTAQVNLLDVLHQATETNVPMTFYDHFSKQVRYNFMHTMDSRGNPDTIPIDPLGTYRLVVHTLPAVEKKNISLTPGKHNVIAVDAPQGDLVLKMNGYNEYNNLSAIVRKSGEEKSLHVQNFEQKQSYLVGKYDLEILSLPRILIEDVNIAQSKTTTVEIPQAGVATIHVTSNGYGSIFLENGDELEWLCNINNLSNRESIVMQPGKYRVIHRATNANKTIYTKEKQFEIKSGQSTQINL